MSHISVKDSHIICRPRLRGVPMVALGDVGQLEAVFIWPPQ